MGNTVILQNDPFFYPLEKPGNGTAHSQSTPVVDIGIKSLDLTGPVDLIVDNCAGGCHLFAFSGSLQAGAIAGDIKARGGHRADGIDHLANGVGPAPGDEQERSISWIHLTNDKKQKKELSDQKWHESTISQSSASEECINY